MIVDALHPAPVAYVPSRCRDERQVLVPVRTPVTIRRLPASAMTLLRPDPMWSNAPRGSFEDGLWSPLPGRRGLMTGDGLAAYLSGGLPQEKTDAAFSGSPLVARLRRGLGWVAQEFVTVREAVPRDLDGARSIRLDRRAAASEALRRYVETDLILVGDVAWRRMRHLAVLRPPSPARLGFVGIDETPSLGSFDALLASACGFDRMLAFARARYGGVSHSGEIEAWRRAARGTDLSGEAGRIACNLLAQPVRELLLAASAHPEREREDGALRELATALEPATLDAAFGGAGGGDPRPLLQALASAIEAAAAGPTATPANVTKESLHAAAAIRLLYLPGLLGPEPPAEDVEAISFAR